MEMALIKNITSSVIFKLTLIVQLPFLVSMLLELMTICVVIFQQRKRKMLEVDEKQLKD